MNYTIIKREETSVIRQVEIELPCLLKVNKYKYIYLTEKHPEIAMILVYDEADYMEVYHNSSSISFEEVSHINVIYEIDKLERIDAKQTEDLLNNILHKFKRFI